MDRSAAIDETQARALVLEAIRAPSSHNTQPWTFVYREGRIDIVADRTRALPVNDPEDRELTMSCGCALMNLRVAAAARGLDADVMRLAGTGDPDILVRIGFAVADEGTAAQLESLAALSPAIRRRQTVRARFGDQDLPANAREDLVARATAEGATLNVIDGSATRVALCELVMTGDALQWENPAWRRELATWIHPRRKGDGLAVPGYAAPIAQQIIRTFDLGGGVAAKDRDLLEHSPILAIISTDGDSPDDWLIAGEALEAVLLTAEIGGLAASYLNQPVEMPPLRARLRELAAIKGHPQILMRLGPVGQDKPPQSPRRPVDAVFKVAGSGRPGH